MPATVADTRPVSWDLGPGALRHTEPRATVEHSPTTCVLCQLSRTSPSPSPGSESPLSRVLSVEFLLCGLRSARRPPPHVVLQN